MEPMVTTVSGPGNVVVKESADQRGFDIDRLPGNHPGKDGGDADVEEGADEQGDDDTDGQIALRVLGFLRGGRDCVEADVGEEDKAGSKADAPRHRRAQRYASPCPSFRGSRNAIRTRAQKERLRV